MMISNQEIEGDSLDESEKVSVTLNLM